MVVRRDDVVVLQTAADFVPNDDIAKDINGNSPGNFDTAGARDHSVFFDHVAIGGGVNAGAAAAI